MDELVDLALTGVVIQAPIALAANVCGVGVNVLAVGLGGPAPVQCDAEGVTTATRSDDGGPVDRRPARVP